jgi:hypothetical protein
VNWPENMYKGMQKHLASGGKNNDPNAFNALNNARGFPLIQFSALNTCSIMTDCNVSAFTAHHNTTQRNAQIYAQSGI